ncbi:hypothetical protein BESB_046300 [Besnoitia besnoiti]|uniref:Flagellar associated protein n=1 Tax=Besnoitia besnoiti TaxID=94643 RepID=A0A2A9MD66_BESBE|nr:hypothetical protein BESB_046300 [Besnoitia besnoiti]PFH36438.1 hypothetical protein BESB_046300 [Besnoitia besnoiti]
MRRVSISTSRESTEKKSRLALFDKEKDVNTVRLQLQEVRRQLIVKKKKGEGISALAAEVEQLKKELHEEKMLGESISFKLENPTEGRQWQELSGEDPDMEALDAKYRLLVKRFRGRQIELLDQDLRLEDLTELTEKQKARAERERDAALHVRNEILRLHGKLLEMNRRMKVTLSELTLYKDYLPKLKELQNATARRVDEARRNVYFGRPATPNAEEELYALIEKEVERDRTLVAAKRRALEDMREQTAFRTTAERRPSQYIPDSNSIGLPVAYGANAPFKPQPPSSNLRHYVTAPRDQSPRRGVAPSENPP